MAALWPKKSKNPKYRFQDSPQGDATWVEIIDGKYAGIIYTYGGVKMDMDSGLPKLSFGFTVLHSGEHDIDHLNSDEEFVTVMGDILTEIIIQNESTRVNDPQKSDLQ